MITNIDALKAKVEPYALSEDKSYAVYLADADLAAEDTYTSGNKLSIIKCAIAILLSFLPLTNETLGPTAQSYNRQGLEERIRALCEEAGLNSDVFITQPTVKIYRNTFF